MLQDIFVRLMVTPMNKFLMNKFFLSFFLTLTFWTASMMPSAALLKVETVETPAGTTAWLMEDRTLPIITLHFEWRGGTAQDPEALQGLTLLMASLLNEGAGPYDSRAFQDRLSFLGTEMRFDADRDSITAEIRMLRPHRNESLALFRSALSEPRFDEEAIMRMKHELKTLIRMRREDPSDRARDLWYASAFNGHPYASPSEGTPGTIDQISADDLRRHHQALMAQDNVIISAFGDISPRELKLVLNELLPALPAQHQTTSIAAHPLQRDGVITEFHEGPQSAVFFGFAGVALNDADFYPAFVLNYILGGGGFASRLTEELREKRGLTYSVYSYLVDQSAAPLWIGGFTSDRSTVAQALTLVREEMAKLREDGVSEKELRDAKTYLEGSYALRFDSGMSIVQQMSFAQWFGLPENYFETRNQFIENVTLEAVNRVAREHLDPEKLLIQIVGTPTGG